jgi:phosphatidylethanolamine-binding protein (PEBP) family uncharacterized protein
MRKILIVLLVFTLIIPVISGSCDGEEDNQRGDQEDQFVESNYSDYINSVLVSSAFSNNDTIPVMFTCDGEDISPDMSWSPGPEGTKSYALICEDPDAVGRTWVHWIVHNIPSYITSIQRAVPRQSLLENWL